MESPSFTPTEVDTIADTVVDEPRRDADSVSDNTAADTVVNEPLADRSVHEPFADTAVSEPLADKDVHEVAPAETSAVDASAPDDDLLDLLQQSPSESIPAAAPSSTLPLCADGGIGSRRTGLYTLGR